MRGIENMVIPEDAAWDTVVNNLNPRRELTVIAGDQEHVIQPGESKVVLSQRSEKSE